MTLVAVALLLAFIGVATAGTCTDTAIPVPVGTATFPGNIIQAGLSCDQAAGPAFGFVTILISNENFDGNFNKLNGQIELAEGSSGAISHQGTFAILDNGDGFEHACSCTGECVPSVVASNSCNKGDYAIDTTGGVVCLKFGSAVEGAALPDVDVDAEHLERIDGDLLVVSVNGAPPVTYTHGSVATKDGGTLLRALILMDDNGKGVFFSECGPFIVQAGSARKRIVTHNVLTRGLAVQQTQGAVLGDPHLSGAHGIKFDVFGAPGANYSLLATPAFEVNMQLAKRGPALRFMTAMSVLYRGKSFTITPWTAKAKRAELIKHFESLGSKISIKDDRVITIELCTGHTIAFAVLHIERDTYLNFRMEVPGCHDAYGGLLGQTYQCKYATEKFEWSRDREDDFRIATLDTASGSYTPTIDCAHEDEYRGKPMSADSFSTKTDDALSMQ